MAGQHFVGIDIASETFMACVLQAPDKLMLPAREFVNDPKGVADFTAWLQSHAISPETAVMCMEATGVYGELLAYLLSAQGWWLAVQPPLAVKRAFHPVGHKNDAVDSRQIAEYAARYQDRLRRFVPKKAILEHMKALLTLREQYVRQRTAQKNALKAQRRRFVRTPLAEKMLQESIQQLNQNITTLDQEIKNLLKQDPDLHLHAGLLVSIPGVGYLLAAHVLLAMASMDDPLNPRALAAHIGICPYEKKSGKSVHKQSTSRGYGPEELRKLLHLGAMSLRTHRQEFKGYFLRKVAEGKPKGLVLNNLANKLIRIMCAVIRNRTPYIPNYRSVNPLILKGALTKS